MKDLAKLARAIRPGIRKGHLLIVEATDQRKNRRILWRCRCDCGNELLLDTDKLHRGVDMDCGCSGLPGGHAHDLRGQRFGKLIALEPTGERSGRRRIIWKCQCDCGNTAYVPSAYLIDGNTKSCGCLHRPPLKALTGERFGQLCVLAYAGRQDGNHLWRCRCDCGAQTVVRQTELQSGKTKSCGCLKGKRLLESMRLVDGTSIALLEASKSARLSTRNTSGYTGVYQNKRSGRWHAQITFKGKTYFLGSYDRIEDAVKRRQRAQEMHDDFLSWYYETQRQTDAAHSPPQKQSQTPEHA